MDSKADERFPRWRRIVKGSDFRSIYRAGRRFETGDFVLFGLPNALGHSRLGLTVSRKVGGAVVRNRVKRLFREIFRRHIAQTPCNFDFVVNAKRECAAAGYAILCQEFLSAARILCRPKG